MRKAAVLEAESASKGSGTVRTMNYATQTTEEQTHAAYNKAVMQSQKRPDSVSDAVTPQDTIPGRIPTVADATQASRYIGIAQRIGLPPPLSQDFMALWGLPLRNGVQPDTTPASEELEMESVDMDSPGNHKRMSHLHRHRQRMKSAQVLRSESGAEGTSPRREPSDDDIGMTFWLPPSRKHNVETFSSDL